MMNDPDFEDFLSWLIGMYLCSFDVIRGQADNTAILCQYVIYAD